MAEHVEVPLTGLRLDEATASRVRAVTQTLLAGVTVGNLLTGYRWPASGFAGHLLFCAVQADLVDACRKAPTWLERKGVMAVLLLQLEAPLAPGCTASLLVTRHGDTEAYRRARRWWPYLAFALDTLMGHGPEAS